MKSVSVSGNQGVPDARSTPLPSEGVGASLVRAAVPGLISRQRLCGYSSSTALSCNFSLPEVADGERKTSPRTHPKRLLDKGRSATSQ